MEYREILRVAGCCDPGVGCSLRDFESDQDFSTNEADLTIC